MNYAIFLVLALCAVLAVASNGNDNKRYVVRRVTATSFDTAVYYPVCEQSNDDEDECDDGEETLPPRKTFGGVIFAQGGSVDAIYYTQVAIKIAQQGFIVGVPNAPRFVFGGQSVQLTNTNITVATKVLLQQLSNDASSPIFGRLENSFALFGHSYGGGVVLVAGSTNGPALCANPANGLSPLCAGYQGFGDGLKAIIAYAGSLTNRRGNVVSVVPVFSMLVPTVFIRGTQDGIQPIADTFAAYNQLQNTTKAFIELEGANHLGINDVQVIPNSSPDPNTQSGTNDYSTNKIAAIVGVALDAHLNGSNRASKLIYSRKDIKIGQTTVTLADVY